MKQTTNHRLIYYSTVLYYACAYIAETIPGGQILLVVALGLMCFAILSNTKGKVVIKRMAFLVYLLVFLLFCAASMLWAQNPALSLSKVNGLFFITIAMLIICVCYNNCYSIQDLLQAIMYGGYIVVLYTYFRYGFSGLLRLMVNDERITNELFNANTIGICTAYSVLINLYYVLNRRLLFRDALIIPAVFLLVVTQSRKAIIIVVLGIIGIYILKSLNKRNFVRSFQRIVVGLCTIALSLFLLSRFSFAQPIVRRISEIFEMIAGTGTRDNNSAWIRFAYTELGIRLFKEKPCFGIGIGNANIYTQAYYGHNHYLHNNFVELLACGGVVGFLIYYSMHFHLFKKYIHYWKCRDDEYNICFVLLLLRTILDYGMVSYYSRANYLFLFLIWSYIKQTDERMVQN